MPEIVLPEPSLDDLLRGIGDLTVSIDAVRAATQKRIDSYKGSTVSDPVLEAEIARLWVEYLIRTADMRRHQQELCKHYREMKLDTAVLDGTARVIMPNDHFWPRT